MSVLNFRATGGSVAPSSPASRQIRFGEFILDLDTAELQKNGCRSTLQGQPFQILQILIERPGSLVTRDELKKRLWPSDTFVDFDQGLNKAVKRLREALEDSADHPKFIETVPRRGYRFIGHAETLMDRSQYPNPPAAKSRIGSFGAGVVRTGVATIRQRWRIQLAASILLLIVCAVILWPVRRSGADSRAGSERQPVDTKRYVREPKYSNLWLVDLTQLSNAQEQPLTWGSSSFSNPSISPDGRWVAFSSKGNIFKMFIDGGQPVQLTSFHAVKSTSPAWSPNGEKIAFICDQGGTPKVWVVNADGGSVRSVSKTNASDTDLQLAWSPSPDVLYQQPGLHNVRRLNVDTQMEEPVLSADSKGLLFSKPIPSPDGKKIAIGWERDNVPEILIITLENNLEEPLYRGFTPLGWSPDGTSIYAYHAGGREIVKLGLKDAKRPESVTSFPGFVYFFTVTISTNGKRIIAAVDHDEAGGDFGSQKTSIYSPKSEFSE
jgi:Tol biopolymer transport system component/DNA-binding winged helix-turn-helix (wHTH) protein